MPKVNDEKLNIELLIKLNYPFSYNRATILANISNCIYFPSFSSKCTIGSQFIRIIGMCQYKSGTIKWKHISMIVTTKGNDNVTIVIIVRFQKF